MLLNDVNPKTLSRIELLKLAQTLRVSDADVMTRAELRAAIERARGPEARPQSQPASWLGKARRLLASVVERGLHLPDAATLIRGGLPVRPFPSGPPPVATVTLARIYAAQGHLVRAIGILDEVVVSDPDHDLARDLRQELKTALEARREQERQQQAASDAAASDAATTGGSNGLASARAAAGGDESAASAPEGEEEAAPSEAQQAASELLGAVPEPDAPSVEEITLAGTGGETLFASIAAESAAAGATVSAAPAPEVLAQPLAAGPAEPELEVETRRGSGVPLAAPASDAEPESELAAVALPAESQAEPSVAAPQPPPTVVAPRPAGLVLIETGEPSAYLYWELATPALGSGVSNGNGASNGNGNATEPHWLCVVTHAPRGAGSERREYRFPVHRASGALRIEGLPKHAVVRAKLSRGEAPDAPPLVVAGSVRVGSASSGPLATGRELDLLKQAQSGYLPYPGADPGALAQRAADQLASAAPLYY